MATFSAPVSGIPSRTRTAPRVVHGLAYGIGASIAMWAAIGAVAYNLI